MAPQHEAAAIPEYLCAGLVGSHWVYHHNMKPPLFPSVKYTTIKQSQNNNTSFKTSATAHGKLTQPYVLEALRKLTQPYVLEACASYMHGSHVCHVCKDMVQQSNQSINIWTKFTTIYGATAMKSIDMDHAANCSASCRRPFDSIQS